MAPIDSYKKNYRCTPAFQQFYTGGPVRLSPDASAVFCPCGDQVKVVDLASGSVRASLDGDTEPITALVLTPDGSSLFAASRSRQIKLWDIASYTCRRAWKAHEGPVADMSIDVSGGLLATASADRSVLVWDVEQGYCTHAFRGHKGVVTTVIFHPDPHRLLLFSGGDDATVRIWDLKLKRCVVVLEKHFSIITSLAVSCNGRSLLSAGRDKVVNVWDLEDNSLLVTVPIFEAVESVIIVPDDFQQVGLLHGKKTLTKKQKQGTSVPVRFLTVGEQGVIRIWLSEGGVCLYEQKSSNEVFASNEETKGGFTGAALLPSCQGFMCVTADQRLLFYEAVENNGGMLDLKINKRLIGHNEEVIDLKFLGEDENYLAVATNLEQVRIYDMATMVCMQELFGHTDIVLCLDTSLLPLGITVLASGSKDHMIRIWDAKSGICLAIAAGHMGAIGAVAFSRKNNNFFVSGSSDHTIKVWSLEGIVDISGSQEPKKLSSLSVVAAHDKDINSLAVAPNDSLVCSGSQDRTARVWRLPELVPLLALRGHKRGIWCVEFSPVDQCVLTASGDKTIRIWALSDGSCLKMFEGHTASVLRASFLTRGTQVISSGADGLVKLWTIKTNECVNTFDYHNDKIWALTVGKQSEMLATGGSDSVVNLWTDCTLADEEEALRKEVEETLKDQDLVNTLAEADYGKAIRLCFELKRPFKLLNVFIEMLKKAGLEPQLLSVLKGLEKDNLRVLLEYIREWNSKPKFCHIAQQVLFQLFCALPPKEIIEVPGVRELLEGIIPYTQRHLSRVDRLVRSTFLLDYTLSAMSVLNPLVIEQPYLKQPHRLDSESQLNGNANDMHYQNLESFKQQDCNGDNCKNLAKELFLEEGNEKALPRKRQNGGDSEHCGLENIYTQVHRKDKTASMKRSRKRSMENQKAIGDEQLGSELLGSVVQDN